MTTLSHDIAEFDIVELTEPVDDAPAGARGGVLELHPGDTAMVEVLDPPLDPAARIIFAPLAKLRVIDPRPWAGGWKLSGSLSSRNCAFRRSALLA